MKPKKSEFRIQDIVFLIIGLVLGIVIAPHLGGGGPEAKNDLVQFVDFSMGGRFGEVVEVQEIPGSQFKAVRLKYVFEEANGGIKTSWLGGLVQNSKNVTLGDEIKFMDIAIFNKEDLGPIWMRFENISEFEPLDIR